MDYPIEALTAAIELEEYTITDKGTYLSISSELQNETKVYKVSTDDANDPLLNPAHLLVGAHAMNKELSNDFAKWLVEKNGGQAVIVGFKKNGVELYSPAP